MLLLASNIHGKTSQKVKTDDILKPVCYLQICTHVTILHSCYNFAFCYMKMHMFSANQKCAIPLYALLCL